MSRKTPLNPIICKARISTDKDGNIISVGQSHNHPPNKLEIQVTGSAAVQFRPILQGILFLNEVKFFFVVILIRF